MGNPLRVMMLGSGTSTGVPVIGCACPVCRSTDPKNTRLRASVYLTTKDRGILIDTSTDLRQQALQYGIPKVDAVLFTHHHADHINGIDELRTYNFLQNGQPIPIYANSETMARVERYFTHIFSSTTYPGGKTNIIPHIVTNQPFQIGPIALQPVPLIHFEADVTGYRIGPFAYLTDCKAIPETSWPLLSGVTHLILDCLRYKSHESHMNLDEALRVIERLRPQRTILTHMTHDFDYTTVRRELPPGVEPGYDGLVFEVQGE